MRELRGKLSHIGKNRRGDVGGCEVIEKSGGAPHFVRWQIKKTLELCKEFSEKQNGV
jgi:hypothetical protein